MKPSFFSICLASFGLAILCSCRSASDGARQNDSGISVKKLIQTPDLRKPLPMFMASDNKCLSCLYDIAGLDSLQLVSLTDSAEARHNENLYIRQWVDSLKLTGQSVTEVMMGIHFEELRYDAFVEQCKIERENRLCDSKSMPAGRLISMYYYSQGMSFNPFVPLEIKTDADGNATLTSGRQGKTIQLGHDIIDSLALIIEKQKLYTLHPSYCRIEPDLPGIQKIRVLDEGTWSFDAKFSDGSVINSRGQGTEPSSVFLIYKFLTESLGLNKFE